MKPDDVKRKTCRHCKKKPVSRPRGLCWKCFYEPGVKELYPSEDVRNLWRNKPATQEPVDLPQRQEFDGLLSRLQIAAASAVAVVTQRAANLSTLDAWCAAVCIDDITVALAAFTARMEGQDTRPDSRRVAELFDLPTAQWMTEAQSS